ncbi:MAG: hypothetical protein AB7E81_08540 [Hyphomicrobiaceae bacterium]
MSKIDDLTRVAAGLSDQQLDGLIDFARNLASQPYFENAPPEARHAIERGMSQYHSGFSEPAADVFRHLRRRLDGTPNSE